MSKAKKGSIKQQEDRRLAEILKAQGNIRGYTSPVISNIKTETKLQEKEESFSLPLADIKRDLIKNGFFAIFSLIIIIILSKTGFGLDHFSKVVKF